MRNLYFPGPLQNPQPGGLTGGTGDFRIRRPQGQSPAVCFAALAEALDQPVPSPLPTEAGINPRAAAWIGRARWGRLGGTPVAAASPPCGGLKRRPSTSRFCNGDHHPGLHRRDARCGGGHRVAVRRVYRSGLPWGLGPTTCRYSRPDRKRSACLAPVAATGVIASARSALGARHASPRP
jgi:hypothetical protein